MSRPPRSRGLITALVLVAASSPAVTVWAGDPGARAPRVDYGGLTAERPQPSRGAAVDDIGPRRYAGGVQPAPVQQLAGEVCPTLHTLFDDKQRGQKRLAKISFLGSAEFEERYGVPDTQAIEVKQNRGYKVTRRFAKMRDGSIRRLRRLEGVQPPTWQLKWRMSYQEPFWVVHAYGHKRSC